MKNKKIIIIWASLLGLLLITVCSCGHKRRSVPIPSALLHEPELSLSETTYNFSGVLVNNFAEREFTITNTGTEPGLEVSSIASDIPEFNIASDNCTAQPLGTDSSCTFVVRFSPTAQVAFAGNISVASNDPPAKTIALTGDGYGLNVWINQADFSNCSDVQVDVTVTDTDGPISSLNIDDFTLWHNNTKQEIVSTIYNSDPVSVVLALDLSYCLTSALPDMKDHAKNFIDWLDYTDEAAILKFETDIISYPPSLFKTTDVDGTIDLQGYIDGPDPVIAGTTALFDAVFESITRAATGNKNKKAVIVFSDGAHNDTTGKTLEEVIDYAIEQNVPLFTICYIYPENENRAQPAIMRQLAEETGGQDYYVDTDTSTMDSVFNQIRNILGSKYVIHYKASTHCSGSIPLRVRADADDLYGIDSRTFIIP